MKPAWAAGACRAHLSPLFEPGEALSELNPLEQSWLKQKAALLVDVFQRSNSNVEGRNGYRSLKSHQLR
jgi:hypothetical protein